MAPAAMLSHFGMVGDGEPEVHICRLALMRNQYRIIRNRDTSFYPERYLARL